MIHWLPSKNHLKLLRGIGNSQYFNTIIFRYLYKLNDPSLVEVWKTAERDLCAEMSIIIELRNMTQGIKVNRIIIVMEFFLEW